MTPPDWANAEGSGSVPPVVDVSDRTVAGGNDSVALDHTISRDRRASGRTTVLTPTVLLLTFRMKAITLGIASVR